MGIDKLEKIEDKEFKKGTPIGCYLCDKTNVTLQRVKINGKKIKPAVYACADCLRSQAIEILLKDYKEKRESSMFFEK